MTRLPFNRPKRVIARFVLSALLGWASFIAIFATYVFVLPHRPDFAPEIGPFGSFVFFAVMFSGYYLVGFFAITIPAALVGQASARRPSKWQWSVIGGILFACVLLLWHIVTFRFKIYDTLFMMLLAFAAGFASFLLLSPSRTSNI